MTFALPNSTKPDKATYDMLQAYRSTPHPAMKLPPYQLLVNREVGTKMDHFPTETHQNDGEVRENDSRYKKKFKEYNDNRYTTKRHTLKPGDAVLVKRENKRRGQTPYEPYVYVVMEIKESQTNTRRIKDE